MAGLNKLEQSQLKALLTDDRWGVFEKFAASLIQSWLEQKPSGQNAFETLRDLHTKEGKIAGVETMLQMLETEAFKD